MRSILALLALLAAGPIQGQERMTSARITKEDFHGWANTYRVGNGLVEARVVTDVGPRILDLRRTGAKNILQPREGLGGSNEPQYVFRGGWRLWVAPERRETTYALDNRACETEVDGDTLRVRGPFQPEAGIRKIVEITPRPGEPCLRIVSRIRNESSGPLTYAAWSLPVLRPGGRALAPLDLGSKTAFDAVRRLILWSYTDIADPRYQFGNGLMQIDHAKVKLGKPGPDGRRPDESKVGSDSSQGWAAYLLDDTLFLERFAHDPQATYPDGGSTIEIYSNHEFLELEHLGPLTTIQPGEEIVLREDWWLLEPPPIPSSEQGALDAIAPFLKRTEARDL